MKNKVFGCLLGGAIGDALGAPVEFDDIKTIQSNCGKEGVTGYFEHGNQGEFTDDTQMTLFTAEGLLRARTRALHKGIGGAENAIVYKAYRRWLQTQGETDELDDSGWLIKQKELHKRRAPGNTCLSALQNKERGSVKNKINNSKGCGTVMRMAPVGIVYHRDRKLAFKKGVEYSAITHGHPSGYLSGGFFASVIADLLNEETLDNSIENAVKELVAWDDHQELLDVIELVLRLHNNSSGNTFSVKTLEVLGEGWVAEEALAISLFCALKFQNNFKKGVLAAVNHSGDSDSTGAITGNILGVIQASNIPQEWIDNLWYHNLVIEVANDLYIGFKDNEGWWEKYPGF